MKAEIIREIWTHKHPYYSGKTSSKTEYKFYVDGELKHFSRNGRPYSHVARYKKSMSKKFNIPVDEIVVK